MMMMIDFYILILVLVFRFFKLNTNKIEIFKIKYNLYY